MQLLKTSIRTKLLVILLAAVLIPSLIIAVILIRSGSSIYRAEAFMLSQGITESIADNINEFINETSNVLQSVVIRSSNRESIRQELDSQFIDFMNRFNDIVMISAYNTNRELITSQQVNNSNIDISNEILDSALKSALSGKTTIITITSSTNQETYGVIIVPLSNDADSPDYIITGVIRLVRLKNIINLQKVNNNTYAYVVDSQGIVIAYPDIGIMMIGKNLRYIPVINESISGRSDKGFSVSDIYIDPAGTRVIASYRRLGQFGWSVVFQQPSLNVFGIYNRQLLNVIIFSLILAIIFGLIGLYFVQSIIRPMEILTRGAEILSMGNFSHRIRLDTGDELENLGNIINRMADNIDQARQQLKMEHDKAVLSASESRILYRVSQALVSSLSIEERLNVIARNLAKVCHTDKTVLWLIEENRLIPYAFYGLSPEENKIFSNWNVPLDETTNLTKDALFRKTPVVIDDLAEDNRLPDNIVKLLDIKSILALPLIFEDNPIGYAITYRKGEKRAFRRYQIELAQAVGAQAAVAIANSRTYERAKRIAEILQRSFLPSVPDIAGDFEIADKYAPALSEAEIGGDFYDLIDLSPTRIALVIADVSGKGLDAAVYTAMIKYMIRAFAVLDLPISKLVSTLNNALYKYISEQAFITLFFGILDLESKQLIYVNAGHELPLVYSEERKLCMNLNTTGTALGISENYEYNTDSISFLPGDVMLMYTDGATDARRDNQFLGMEGLESIFCNAVPGRSAHKIVDIVEDEIREYAYGLLRDDIALMVVRYLRADEKFTQ
ncbi:MAG: SpoIIE family protein phosphatase [Armatimonadota bacterium]